MFYHSFDYEEEAPDHDLDIESEPSTPFKQSIPVPRPDDESDVEEIEVDTKPVVKMKAKKSKATKGKKKSKKSKAKTINDESELPQIRTPEIPKDNSAELKTITKKVTQQTNKIEKDSKEALDELTKSKSTANKTAKFINKLLQIVFLIP
ncbi:unnamed protein product [Ambrosiozyma monospora]|uniref:Unnamed protein product n=1 Tax=Ambrosiozyma monospora TaxID=43982 RepID=A0ACB5UA63_AMBMO|nr:unnamed protein product [Ambrosiozyma monospora]